MFSLKIFGTLDTNYNCEFYLGRREEKVRKTLGLGIDSTVLHLKDLILVFTSTCKHLLKLQSPVPRLKGTSL
jgi:hypothetical protein